jgi:5-methylcytosine-specific restriction endonuclease McrA
MKKYSKKYLNYMKSKKWRNLRIRVAKRDRFICQRCHRYTPKGFNIHHLSYERLGNERLSDLILLCPKCHKKTHRKSYNKLVFIIRIGVGVITLWILCRFLFG